MIPAGVHFVHYFQRGGGVIVGLVDRRKQHFYIFIVDSCPMAIESVFHGRCDQRLFSVGNEGLEKFPSNL